MVSTSDNPKFEVDFEAKVEEFNKKLDNLVSKVDKSTNKMDKDVQKFSNAFNKSMVALGAAAVVAATAIAALTIKSIDNADKLAKMSRETGLSVESLSRLQLASDQSGVELTQLSSTITKLQRSIGEASLGNQQYSESIRQLGLNTQDLLKLSPEEQFNKVVDALANIDNQTRRTTLGQQLLGRSFNSLATLIEGGSSKMEEFNDISDRIGLTLSTETSKQAEIFNDNLDLMWQSVKGVGNSLATVLLPSLVEITNRLVSATTAAAEFIRKLFGIRSANIDIAIDEVSTKIKELETQIKEFNEISGGRETLAITYSKQQLDDLKKELVELQNKKVQLSKNNDPVISEGNVPSKILDRLVKFKDALEALNKKIVDANNESIGLKEGLTQLERQSKAAGAELRRAAAKDVEELRKKLDEGVISQEQFNKTLEEMGLTYDSVNKKVKVFENDFLIAMQRLEQAQRSPMAGITRGLEQIRSEFTDIGSGIENLLVKGAQNFEDAYLDALEGTTDSFKKFFDFLRREIIKLAIRQSIITPLLNLVTGGTSSLFGFEHGGLMQTGKLTPLANGGLVTQPSILSAGRGQFAAIAEKPGLQEFVMPAIRTPSGDLGVRAVGSSNNKGMTQLIMGDTILNVNADNDEAIIQAVMIATEERTRNALQNFRETLG